LRRNADRLRRNRDRLRRNFRRRKVIFAELNGRHGRRQHPVPPHPPRPRAGIERRRVFERELEHLVGQNRDFPV